MKNTTLFLLLLLSSKLALAIDPDAVKAAYRKLNIEITADQSVIEAQYRKLISVDGVAFTKEGQTIKAAKELIITFIKEYDVDILTDSNKSFIFKKEYFAKHASLKEKFMRLVEDNANRLKFAFTAPYSGDDWGGFDDSPRRPVRARETIYPAYYEINSYYRSFFDQTLSETDLKVMSAALDFQINSKISIVKELKDNYFNLSLEAKELYSILMSILADEGTRLDIHDNKRTEHFLGRIQSINEAVNSLNQSKIAKLKGLFQSMSLEGGLIDGAFAPYYFDTIVLLNKDLNSNILAMAPREVNEKFFLFHGTLAPFIGLNLNDEGLSALNRLAFQLAANLKKDLGDSEFATVNAFDLEKKRIALVLEITGMVDEAVSPSVFNMSVEELENLRATYIRDGKVSCMDLINLFH